MRATVGLARWQFWLLNGLAAVALGLVLTNAWVTSDNRELQAEIQQRQAFINESLELSRLNTQVIRALATLSAESGDEELRELLASHGIEFSFEPAATRPVESQPAGESP